MTCGILHTSFVTTGIARNKLICFTFLFDNFFFVLDRIRHILPAFRTKDNLNRHGRSSFLELFNIAQYADYLLISIAVPIKIGRFVSQSMSM